MNIKIIAAIKHAPVMANSFHFFIFAYGRIQLIKPMSIPIPPTYIRLYIIISAKPAEPLLIKDTSKLIRLKIPIKIVRIVITVP